MTIDEALAVYGTRYQIAKVLGMTPPACYNWGDKIPLLRQYQLEDHSGGKLRADRQPAAAHA